RAVSHPAGEKLVVNEDSYPLGGARWEHAPALHIRQIALADRTVAQRVNEPIGRRHGVLDGEINPDATYRRHRVRRVTDAQEPRPVPSPQPVDFDGQELDVIPAGNLADAVAQVRHELDDRSAERFEAPRPHFVGPALRDEKSALPIISAIEYHHHLASADATEQLRTVTWAPR